MKTVLIASSLLLLTLVGCDSNPTNAPTEDAIKKANVDRAKAIDDDPTLTPEGKQKMKEMLRLDSTAPADTTKGRG